MPPPETAKIEKILRLGTYVTDLSELVPESDLSHNSVIKIWVLLLVVVVVVWWIPWEMSHLVMDREQTLKGSNCTQIEMWSEHHNSSELLLVHWRINSTLSQVIRQFSRPHKWTKNRWGSRAYFIKPGLIKIWCTFMQLLITSWW